MFPSRIVSIKREILVNRRNYNSSINKNRSENPKKINDKISVRPKLSGYVYIGKDIEDARSFYKFGYTTDLNKRLISYKTGQPNFEFIVRIKTLNYQDLEKSLIKRYKPYLYRGETFKNINLNEVKKQLKSWGYLPNADQIFTQQKN